MTNRLIIIVTESGIVASKIVLPKRKQDDLAGHTGIRTGTKEAISPGSKKGEGQGAG